MYIHVPKDSYRISSDENNRKITINPSIFGILFQQLKKNIGEKRVKSFLFHYGWEMGVHDGKEALEQDFPKEAYIRYGPRLHINSGHIRGIEHESRAEFDEDGNLLSIFSEGSWLESYEAREYLKVQGVSETPVCHTLAGYSSGYMSTIFHKPILAKEITCVGCGHEKCSWELKTKEEWEKENEEGVELFEEETIINELSYTYEQLLDQRKFLQELADFQKELTDEIINGSDLKKLVNKASDMIQTPIIIESAEKEYIAHSGLTEEQYHQLQDDLKANSGDSTYLFAKQPYPSKGEIIRTDIQTRLFTPLIVQKRIVGFCSFVYKGETDQNFEKDYLFLDRFSNAISLVMLNEKTEFESMERMKGNFLERMIAGRLPKNEIIKRGNYTGMDLSNPYYIMVIDYETNLDSMEEEFQLGEDIYESIIRYFNSHQEPILAGHYERKLIICNTIDKKKTQDKQKIITGLHALLKKKYKNFTFSFGISTVADDIEQINKYVEEATVCIGLTTGGEITFFRDLGILGILINSGNKQAIKLLAEEKLGPVFEEKNEKELIRTLYLYLLNGGKLEKTMNDLALSMGGLRHRIRKLEDILEVDLRNANVMHELLLLLQSLIALGEWDFEK
ncbi:V4R domain-containing protein [Virgibacillus sediminis]|uniref:V4R domain-containing protein n=1 Tax=Virgibacillus sediminis TaxID=202260 RepID=A0ABV7A4R6_9BACI